MITPVLSDLPDDADTADVCGHAAVPAEVVAEVWPARHFSIDPASSPVLVAAFAWAPPAR